VNLLITFGHRRSECWDLLEPDIDLANLQQRSRADPVEQVDSAQGDGCGDVHDRVLGQLADPSYPELAAGPAG